jgi:SagB-type dehydrogenase family enzyme
MMPLAALSVLLFAASGVTRHSPGFGQPGLRAAPSAGALYPLDAYVIARRVETLPARLFHYDPDRHALTGSDGDGGVRAVTDALIDPAPGDASAVLIFVACFPRSRIKYGLRAYRFVLLEAGHVAQNVLLAASALGLAALPIGGFYDRRIEDALSLDGLHESPIYLIAVGSRVEEPGG